LAGGGEERGGEGWWAAAGPKGVTKPGWARRKERKGEKVLGLWVFFVFFNTQQPKTKPTKIKATHIHLFYLIYKNNQLIFLILNFLQRR
jgi:hypothetical protein